VTRFTGVWIGIWIGVSIGMVIGINRNTINNTSM
jgi:preprotein translocase subunit SecG